MSYYEFLQYFYSIIKSLWNEVTSEPKKKHKTWKTRLSHIHNTVSFYVSVCESCVYVCVKWQDF